MSGPATVNGITRSCIVKQAVKCLAGSGTTSNCKLHFCPQQCHSASAAKARSDFLMISKDIKEKIPGIVEFSLSADKGKMQSNG